MTTIGFIGLGTMDLPMASVLIDAGFPVTGFDCASGALQNFEAKGGRCVGNATQVATQADVVVTMLPEGEHVSAVYIDEVLTLSTPPPLCIDCSTIDVETARKVANSAADKGVEIIDAPVSGGPEGAQTGTLSFMVGGSTAGFERSRPILETLGKRILHFGPAGSGQAAKACHNMICGITSLAVCESFALAAKLGLNEKSFFELCAGAAAQSWILENRCPVPGVAENTPASNGYRPEFSAGLMAKDLRLAQRAAKACGQSTPFGAAAAARFTEFATGNNAQLDFSAIYNTMAQR